MSIATVVTLGYGSFGSVNKIPTVGYSIGEVVVVVAPLTDPYRPRSFDQTETRFLVVAAEETRLRKPETPV